MGRRGRNLLWFDSGAGATAGVLMVALHGWLVELHQLPSAALWCMAAANIGYASYSESLALRASQLNRLPRVAVDLLVFANVAWGLVCVGLLLGNWATVTTWGIAHLVFEGAFVAGLGLVEFRVVRPETLSPQRS
ncbi:MAG: hypothetical protein R3B07_30395 [Polyangiaceae bacterium]